MNTFGIDTTVLLNLLFSQEREQSGMVYISVRLSLISNIKCKYKDM